jgi:hypothetical protein
LLPGNSIRNKAWIYEVGDALSPLFEDSYIHNYSHWGSGEENIDFDLEAKKLSEKISGLKNYVIFAKSIGSVLALDGINKQALKPTKCMFCDIPLKMILEESIPLKEWLSRADMQIVIIQNSHDPMGTYEELKSYLQPEPKLKIIDVAGDTQSYNDFDLIKRTVADLIG